MSYQNIKSAGTGKFKLYSGSQDYIKSVVFFSCLVATLLVSLFYAYTSSGPIILGSELNAQSNICALAIPAMT